VSRPVGSSHGQRGAGSGLDTAQVTSFSFSLCPSRRNRLTISRCCGVPKSRAPVFVWSPTKAVRPVAPAAPVTSQLCVRLSPTPDLSPGGPRYNWLLGGAWAHRLAPHWQQEEANDAGCWGCFALALSCFWILQYVLTLRVSTVDSGQWTLGTRAWTDGTLAEVWVRAEFAGRTWVGTNAGAGYMPIVDMYEVVGCFQPGMRYSVTLWLLTAVCPCTQERRTKGR
jgi:hypothetical protein